MTENYHLLLFVPEDLSNEDKGVFYENFIAELLRPMRLRVERRLRVTGMEIDLLAKGEDSPRTVLIECKAHRDPIAADVITKLIGNVNLRRADAGWLFSTSDLTKDGRGLWQEIQDDPDHARLFTWYSPSRTLEVLIAQRSVVNPISLNQCLAGFDLGDWSLIVTPAGRFWLVELLEEGVPAKYVVFDAKNGVQRSVAEARTIARASPRYASLRSVDLTRPTTSVQSRSERAVVARVISGDAWNDPRPARPIDFVGRDEIIRDMGMFIEQVRTGQTSTRTFAVLAPSGWGKSSLALKLVKQADSEIINSCSITAVDSRSASSASFVAEALRLAIRDAAQKGVVDKNNQIRIQSLREPLGSSDLKRAIDEIRKTGWVVILLFDQFEELFSKESLFEVFNAVRDLSLDVDASQAPLILGFAWKTDVSLPQQHPAYHLWHQLADRRRAFRVSEFGRGEVARVISKAERASGNRLSKPLRSRLVEQCQGLPWLLKKLLVHVLQRVSTNESQYLLLERELDIELLFKEDLEQLQDEHIRCLKFIASRAPVAVAEVEEGFLRDVTNHLINQHLLVRSGMNYVIYWDIFRDYLVEERVPEIPWARTFQRMPSIALKALEVLEEYGPLTALALGEYIKVTEGAVFNILGDLVALQLVDSSSAGLYQVAAHLGNLTPASIARVTRNQLKRHVVSRAIERSWEKGRSVEYEDWVNFVSEEQLRTKTFSRATRRSYARTLRGWLLFAGLLEARSNGIARPDGEGAQMGTTTSMKLNAGRFLGTSKPSRLQDLIFEIYAAGKGVPRSILESRGFRNAIADAIALGLATIREGNVCLCRVFADEASLLSFAKELIGRQATVGIAVESMRAASGQRKEAARLLATRLDASWKPVSSVRNLGGLLRYATWANLTESGVG